MKPVLTTRLILVCVCLSACHHGDGAGNVDGNTTADGSRGDASTDGGTPVLGAFCVEDNWCWQRPSQFGTSLFGIWGTSPSDVWAVGAGGTIAHYDGAGWKLSHSGTYADLNGIWGSSTTDVWAVGTGGTLVHFDGTSWSSVASPTTSSLNAIYGTSTTDIYAVGDDDTRLHWNGTWTALPTVYPGAMYVHQYGVWASSSGEAWSAGIPYTDAIPHRTGGSWTTTPVASIGTLSFKGVWGSGDSDVWLVGTPGVEGFLQRWNGSSWSSVYPPSEVMLDSPIAVTGSGPNDVWFFGGWYGAARWNGATFVAAPDLTYEYLTAGWVDPSGDGWTVGYGGRMAHKATLDGGWTFSAGSPSGGYDTLAHMMAFGDSDVWAVGRLSITHWDGTSWTDIAPATTEYRQEFNDVWGASAIDVWATSWGSASPDNLQHWNGTVWTTTAHPGPAQLNAVWGSAGNDVWIVYSGGNGGMHYDGHTWTTTIAGPVGDPSALHGTASTDIWCVGQAGMISHYDGLTWTATVSSTTANLGAVHAFSADDAWAAGDGATLLHWTAGAWQPAAIAPPLTGTDTTIVTIAGASSTDLWIATTGGQVFHFDGVTWTRSAQLSVGIFALARTPSGAVFAAGGNGSILRHAP